MRPFQVMKSEIFSQPESRGKKGKSAKKAACQLRQRANAP